MKNNTIFQRCVFISISLSVLLCSFFTLSQPVSKPLVAPEPFVFMVIYAQEPPLLHSAKNSSEYRGIVPDILSEIGGRLNLDISYLPTSRNKMESALLDGTGDALYLAPEWIKNPSKLIFSEPIMKHEEFLYSLKPFSSEDNAEEWLKDKLICLREDFIYPVIQTFIDKGITKRKDVSSQAPMVSMLLKGRCELIYLTGYLAEWEIKDLGATHSVFRSPKPLETTHVTIGLAKKWQPILSALNESILEFKAKGKIEKIIQRNMQAEAEQH
ncbi:MAG: polar amino acid transport system substrate-binding protein [Paraglaciecola sp.]|jgi:polar amino acid transport system substrate-binding protein